MTRPSEALRFALPLITHPAGYFTGTYEELPEGIDPHDFTVPRIPKGRLVVSLEELETMLDRFDILHSRPDDEAIPPCSECKAPYGGHYPSCPTQATEETRAVAARARRGFLAGG